MHFFQDRLVLVTGGTGFVGGHFVEALLRAGARVRVPIHLRPLRVADERIETIQADLTQPDDCILACRHVDCVVHAAGAVSAAGTTIVNPMEPITQNLVLTAHILQAAWAEQVGRILIFSSSTGYPAFTHPVREEEFWSGPPHPSFFGYGWMRRYLEQIGSFVHDRSNTKVAIVRPTATYGRHDDFDPHSGHVIPALIRRALAKENPFVVWGTEDVVRDFLHITDLVRGSLLVLANYAEADAVNIGCGKPETIGQIVSTILEVAGHKDAVVEYDSSKPTTIPFRVAEISKAQRLLGFQPQIPLQEGLRDTVEWFKCNSSNRIVAPQAFDEVR